mmetsp:Transcript_54617/g.144853  ORF Transcript_54617/g.144853 Transcript_54617/m.144853 type:complete len:245 (-) Transcript_54617:1667-2401(-)
MPSLGDAPLGGEGGRHVRLHRDRQRLHRRRRRARARENNRERRDGRGCGRRVPGRDQGQQRDRARGIRRQAGLHARAPLLEGQPDVPRPRRRPPLWVPADGLPRRRARGGGRGAPRGADGARRDQRRGQPTHRAQGGALRDGAAPRPVGDGGSLLARRGHAHPVRVHDRPRRERCRQRRRGAHPSRGGGHQQGGCRRPVHGAARPLGARRVRRGAQVAAAQGRGRTDGPRPGGRVRAGSILRRA